MKYIKVDFLHIATANHSLLLPLPNKPGNKTFFEKALMIHRQKKDAPPPPPHRRSKEIYPGWREETKKMLFLTTT